MTVDQEGRFCQSCGIPVLSDDELGTDSKGKKSADYCKGCFSKGKFTSPEITCAQMVARSAGIFSARMHLPMQHAHFMAQSRVPFLKRWKGKN